MNEGLVSSSEWNRKEECETVSQAFFYEKQADVLMKSACVVCVLLLYLFLASYSKKEMKRGVEEENNNKSSN